MQVEGLRSQKAIAFIGNEAYKRLKSKTYSTLRMFPQIRTRIFLQNIGSRVEAPVNLLINREGDEKWRK